MSMNDIVQLLSVVFIPLLIAYLSLRQERKLKEQEIHVERTKVDKDVASKLREDLFVMYKQVRDENKILLSLIKEKDEVIENLGQRITELEEIVEKLSNQLERLNHE